MSSSFALDQGRRPPWRRRGQTLLVVGAARLLALLPPRRIRQFLRLARVGAEPATADQAAAARADVTAVSVYCAGEGCVPRSIATALLCRARGSWPDWHVGVRTEPFAAHAWVSVGGVPVGEPYGEGYYRPILSVPVRPRRQDRRRPVPVVVPPGVPGPPPG